MTELLQQLRACIGTQTNSDGETLEVVDTAQAVKLIIQILDLMNQPK